MTFIPPFLMPDNNWITGQQVEYSEVFPPEHWLCVLVPHPSWEGGPALLPASDCCCCAVLLIITDSLSFFDCAVGMVRGKHGTNTNKLALLWGEAQKKIAYSYLKVTYCYTNVNYSGLKVTYS